MLPDALRLPDLVDQEGYAVAVFVTVSMPIHTEPLLELVC